MRLRLLVVFSVAGLMMTACAEASGGQADDPRREIVDVASTSLEPVGGAERSDLADPGSGAWVLIDENDLVEELGAAEDHPSELSGGQESGGQDSTTDATGPRKAPIEGSSKTATPPASGNVPEGLLQAVKADAAGRAGAAESAVSVIRAQAVVWNDGSFGCPRPGQMYTQALVNGYWIVVEVGGREYDYRASQEGYFKLCVGGGADPYAVDR